jgi:hypothetical protein
MAKWIDTGKGAELVPVDIRTLCPNTYVQQDRHGRDVRIACRKCASCRKFALICMTGALQQEAIMAGSTWFLSLTYASNEFGEGTFYYRHVQHLMMKLRYHYPGVRFFCVGEKGTLNGRNHWHMILFFKDFQPIPELRKGIPARYGQPAVKGELWEHWPHGYANFQQVEANNPRSLARRMRYVATYLYPENPSKPGSYDTIRAHWSCKPVLGYAYLMRQADQYAAVNKGQLRLPLYVSFPGDRVAQGGPLWRYPITGARRGHYIRRYYETCQRLYGETWGYGGIEVDEKVTLKDLLGARGAKAHYDHIEDMELARKLASKENTLKFDLKTKWSDYDEKETKLEYNASFEGYSRPRGGTVLYLGKQGIYEISRDGEIIATRPQGSSWPALREVYGPNNLPPFGG